MSKHKWLPIIGVITILFLITGCSGFKSTQDKNTPNSGTESKEVKPQSTTKLETDADLTKQLEAEKGIEKVMVQVVEGEQRSVNVDIAINNEQELSADEVINKYSAVIKEKYPDRTIDIIVVKDGKKLKQVTLK
ncbi:hypothetical protein E4K67_00745 [Desulfosporosinus fructosivorans]|uniref:Uncharacterized protein n=1 Tax=Desulfosporosinus fructosivorans TaxID=2018669 RepID=A0A4Z0RB79_9FIRM|nr:hypothetical protein [Desulfosporosinus fructosivorans]TGE39575.1 hypothetical protein E4K67_00745 [Desulfosporosinus fructosivorans]